MNVFDVFLVALIIAFLVLFALLMIVAYSNRSSIKRIYKMIEIIREHEDDDYWQIRKLKRAIGGMQNGKSK